MMVVVVQEQSLYLSATARELRRWLAATEADALRLAPPDHEAAGAASAVAPQRRLRFSCWLAKELLGRSSAEIDSPL